MVRWFRWIRQKFSNCKGESAQLFPIQIKSLRQDRANKGQATCRSDDIKVLPLSKRFAEIRRE